MLSIYMRHFGVSQYLDIISASACGWCRWILTCVGMTLLGILFSVNACAAEPKKIDAALCRQVTKHTPSADVAYQPGVDVNGNAVAPADLAGMPQIQMPTKSEIPITVNLAKVLNLNTNQYPNNVQGAGTESWIGTFTVDGDKTYFNGQPLTDAQQDNLAVLCVGQK